MVQLTHRHYRLERRTETVTLVRPGTSQTVSETVSWTDDEGNTSLADDLGHPFDPVGHGAEGRDPGDRARRARARRTRHSVQALTTTRTEQLTLGSGIAADDAYRALVVPEREPERPALGPDQAHRGGTERAVRDPRLGAVAMRRFFTIITSLGAAALFSTAAASDEEAARQAMLDAFDAALTAVAYASSGLALFALVWAGFLLEWPTAPRVAAPAPARPSSSRSPDLESRSRPKAWRR